jgi:hypothetical protein
MAVKLAVPIVVYFVGDGVASSFSFDLLSDPYSLPVELINWFTTGKKLPNPVGVFTTIGPNVSVTLNGTIVTLSVAAAGGPFPEGQPIAWTVYVLFNAEH